MIVSKYKVVSFAGCSKHPGTRMTFNYRCRSLVTGRVFTMGWYERRRIGYVFETPMPDDMA